MKISNAQYQALKIMRHPAYTADGTKVNDRTGFVLKKKGLAFWNAGENKWDLTEEAYDFLNQN